MNLKEIQAVINLMNENDLTEIEIEREGTKIKIKKASGEPTEGIRKIPATYQLETAPAPTAAKETKPEETYANKRLIKSPMVGTFYRAPSPESPLFVEVGQTVEVGQVVCIVEAMKLMNEIKSEVKGKVAEILVENAQPVEFGQILFVLEPA